MAEPITIDNPGTGEIYTFLRRAKDTDGELLQMHWTAGPGGKVGEHIHPLQQEKFEVRTGELTVSVEGRKEVFRPGQVASVSAGTRHYVANEGDEPVTAVLEIRPALRMEQVFETLAGLAREGKTRADGLPRNLLQLAVFASEFSSEIRGAKPPYVLQRLVLPGLAALGRARGYRAHHPRYRAEVLAGIEA